MTRETERLINNIRAGNTRFAEIIDPIINGLEDNAHEHNKTRCQLIMSVIDKILPMVHKDGIREGEESAQLSMRQALGIYNND